MIKELIVIITWGAFYPNLTEKMFIGILNHVTTKFAVSRVKNHHILRENLYLSDGGDRCVQSQIPQGVFSE